MTPDLCNIDYRGHGFLFKVYVPCGFNLGIDVLYCNYIERRKKNICSFKLVMPIKRRGQYGRHR